MNNKKDLIDITDYLLDSHHKLFEEYANGKYKHRTLIPINRITHFSFYKDIVRLWHYDDEDYHCEVSLKNGIETLEMLERYFNLIELKVENNARK